MDGVVHAGSQHTQAAPGWLSLLNGNPPSSRGCTDRWGGWGQFRPCMAAAKMALNGAWVAGTQQCITQSYSTEPWVVFDS